MNVCTMCMNDCEAPSKGLNIVSLYELKMQRHPIAPTRI